MKITMNVQGLNGVMQTLQSLPAEVVSKRGGPVKLALAKAARVIQAQAKTNLRAIVAGSEDTTGLLEKNVVVTRGKEPRGTKGERYLVRVRRKAYDGGKIGKRQKAGKRVTTHKTASLLEYGSSHQPATPWLRPAVEQKGEQAISVFTSDLNRRIDQTVKKLAQQNKEVMLAPIFKTINTPAVQAIVGSRIYGKGMAPQNVAAPYITWFTVVGDPYTNISEAPHGDNDTIQIDCWAGPADDQEGVVNQLAKAVRDAIDAAGQACRIIIDTREADTKLFRIGLQVEFIHNR